VEKVEKITALNLITVYLLPLLRATIILIRKNRYWEPCHKQHAVERTGRMQGVQSHSGHGRLLALRLKRHGHVGVDGRVVDRRGGQRGGYKTRVGVVAWVKVEVRMDVGVLVVVEHLEGCGALGDAKPGQMVKKKNQIVRRSVGGYLISATATGKLSQTARVSCVRFKYDYRY